MRIYALYLEERLECFRVLKYDVETDPPVCNLMQAYFSYLLHFQKVFKSHFHLYICSGPCNYMLMSWHKILPCCTILVKKRTCQLCPDLGTVVCGCIIGAYAQKSISVYNHVNFVVPLPHKKNVSILFATIKFAFWCQNSEMQPRFY